MKIKHLISLFIILCACIFMVLTGKNASVYVTFATAKTMQPQKVHIIGTLYHKNNEDRKNVYATKKSIINTSFLMKDKKNTVVKVHYNAPLPQDLKHAEQLVVVGNFTDDHFFAEKILLKCPSKYNQPTLKY